MTATATAARRSVIDDASVIDVRVSASRRVVADITLLSTAALAIEEVQTGLGLRKAGAANLGTYALLTHRVESKRRALAAESVSWDAMYRLYAKACERFGDLALVPDDMELRRNALRAKISEIDAL